MLPEQVEVFDRQWREVMWRGADDIDLAGPIDLLEVWRLVAWQVTVEGPERYRALLAAGEQRARSDRRPSGARPWREVMSEFSGR